ncbi:MAG: cation-translocating P-type ATPase [Firmicutes bacterium]|nr:cation-translocating P-type ATPase [Bacillota bacterium]
MQKLSDCLAGLPATVISGICVALSLILPRAGIHPSIDPAWGAVILSGFPLLYLAVWRMVHNTGVRRISSALLITIAMLAALAIGDLFAAGEVAFIMAIGALLEQATTNRAKKGLKKLISLAPVQGRRVNGATEEMVPVAALRPGDVVRILPGEIIPVDGTVIDGESSVDQSIMTGESLPVDKAQGDQVFCGTMNCFGAIDVTTTNVGADSSLQQLIRMVQEAEDKQAPMQRLADQWASWLVPVAVTVAIIAGLATHSLVRAVTVLVVFCPCALVLATPTAIMAAIGQATKHGVIIKSGEALEKMGKVSTIIFDKTGTLTYGRLQVSDILPFDETVSERDLLFLAASAEAKSEHPLGQAIVAHAKAENISLEEVKGFKMTSGKGIYGEAAGRRLLCGNEKFLRDNQAAIHPAAEQELARLRNQGKASVLVAAENRCIGVISLSDVLRPEAKDTVCRLSGMHVNSVLLTGDHSQTARYFGRQAGFSQVYGDLLPADKLKYIEGLQERGESVCMIGDGVNDAPALKAAGVGVAMGSMGSDIAVEAADIALMQDDISKIPYLKRLANATMNTIKLSISLSMCINFVAVWLSTLGKLTPTTGALVHNAGSCLVVLIAALLYDRKFA